ncbi:DUF6134 family protein [Flavobacterium sp.]|uniref:DUF6134 family protein n=1 Tax=Flavobacterium sp. TaxID=239 RepID=UPI0037A1C1F8
MITYAQTETLVYDLKVSGKIIGTVTAKKSVQGNFVTYLSDTDAKISFLGSTQIKTIMKVVFENGKLYESDYKFYKNNKIKEESSITSKNGKYIIIHDGKTSLVYEPIYASSIILPFYKPKDNEKIFEEVEGYFKSIKLVNNKSFQLLDPKSSHKDKYIYENGKMEYCLVNNTLVDFEMVLQTKYYSQNINKI